MESSSNVAQQIARVASAFEQQRSGRAPEPVTVVVSENSLVIAVHGVLRVTESAFAKAANGRRSLAGVPSTAVR